MLITLYPNNEIRARIPRPVLTSRPRREAREMVVPASILSIAEKLQQKCPDAIAPPSPEKTGRVGYGVKPRLREFSVYARRKIARAGGLLGQPLARPSTLFLTGTLPGSTDEAMAAISCQSSWIVHRLLTGLPRLWGGKPSDAKWIWVWEFQKRGALHWHCVVQLPSRLQSERIRSGFHSLWVSVLLGAGKRSGVDIAARHEGGTWLDSTDVWRTEAAPARKNPARYLAKYMSKIKIDGRVSSEYPPTRWYGLSRNLHRELPWATYGVQTSTKTGHADCVVDESVDLPLLSVLESLSNCSRHFPDKVGDGYTFVFYVPEEKRDEVVRIMRGFEPGELEDQIRFGGTSRPVYYGLRECAAHPWLLERLLLDVGMYYRCVYESWANGDRVPDSELFWLDHYAHQILHRAGWTYRGQPPERSVVGLPGQSSATMESSDPVPESYDQSSLFP